MKEREQHVLCQLRRNGRLPFAAIGRRIGVPTSSVFDIYRRLQPFILKHAPLLDFGRLGYHLQKFFVLRPRKRERAAEQLVQHSCINNLYRLEGGQLLCQAIFTELHEVELFRKELRKYGRYKEHDILGELQLEAFTLPQGA